MFCIDNEESDCTIYDKFENEYEGREVLTYYANKDEGHCLIQAVKQLIDKENDTK